MTPTRQTIKIDALRSVCVEVVGPMVNLSLMVAGMTAVSQPIPAEASQALGGALTMAAAAAKAGAQ